RSPFSYRHAALPALEALLATLTSRYVLVSYSTDGMISLEALVDAACRRGHTEVVTRRYKRYRVSSQRYSTRGHNVEFVLIVDTRTRSGPERAPEIARQIRAAASFEPECDDR